MTTMNRPWLTGEEDQNTAELEAISKEIRSRSPDRDRALDLATRLLDIIDDLDKLHRTAPAPHRLPIGTADRQIERIRSQPVATVIKWLAYDAAAWHAGDTNLDVGYVASAYMEVLMPLVSLAPQVPMPNGRS